MSQLNVHIQNYNLTLQNYGTSEVVIIIQIISSLQQLLLIMLNCACIYFHFISLLTIGQVSKQWKVTKNCQISYKFWAIGFARERCWKDSNLQSFTQYLRQTLDFMWKSEIKESSNLYISAVFCQHNIYFGRKTGHWTGLDSIILMKQ